MSLVFSVIVIVFTWFRTRGSRVDTKFEKVDERLDELERTVDQIPNRESVHQISLALTEIAGQIGVVNEKLRGYGEATRKLERWLERQDRYIRSKDTGE